MLENDLKYKNRIKFFVDKIFKDENGKIAVPGINCEKFDIEIGDIFNVKFEVVKEDLLSFNRNPRIVNIVNVNLIVKDVLISRHRPSIGYLPIGYGGAIYFDGDGVLDIVDDCMLCGEKTFFKK